MAVVCRRTAKGRKVYWVAFYDAAGKQQWERVGSNEREAEAVDRLRKKQVEDGTYAKGLRPTMPFGEFLSDWLSRRTNRNAKEDRSQATRFLLSRKWLCDLPCEDFRPKHSIQLVAELKAMVSEETGKTLSQKYVSNLYGIYSTAVRDARVAELMPVDPCSRVLPKGFLRRKSKRNARTNYETEDIILMLSCPDDEARVLALLALLTGMREGEVCGRRFRDWDRHSVPLGCLLIASQYNDQPLKGDHDEIGEAARKAPVHPALASVLEWWWSDGFEFTYCRKPTRDDFIVPRKFKGDTCLNHTRSSAYKLWRKACEAAGVKNRSLHSTRHTFLTLTQRGGARDKVIEQVTHNAAGTTVDHYTHWTWGPLCEAVMCLKLPLDPVLDMTPGVAENKALESGGAGNRSEGRSGHSPVLLGSLSDPEPPGSGGILRRLPGSAAPHCAAQEIPTEDHKARGADRNRPRSASFQPLPADVQDVVAGCLAQAIPLVHAGDAGGALAALERGAAAIDGAVGAGAT
jgi:integrase